MKPVPFFIIVILIVLAGGFYVKTITDEYETKVSAYETQVADAAKEKALLENKITYLAIEKDFLLAAPSSDDFRFIVPNSDYTLSAQTYTQEKFEGKPLKAVKETIITINPVSATNKDAVTAAIIPQPTTNNGKTIGRAQPVGFYKNQYVYAIDFDGRGGECTDPWVNNSGDLYAISTNPPTSTIQTPEKFTITPEIKGWILENTTDSCKAQLSAATPTVTGPTDTTAAAATPVTTTAPTTPVKPTTPTTKPNSITQQSAKSI